MLGICLGMQLTCVEFARHVLGLADANSAELNPDTLYPIIDLMRDQIDVEDLGGTLRLGLYPSKVKRNSKAAADYDYQEIVQRCHRHSGNPRKQILCGLSVSPRSFQVPEPT